jgi:hypothetical protein
MDHVFRKLRPQRGGGTYGMGAAANEQHPAMNALVMTNVTKVR